MSNKKSSKLSTQYLARIAIMAAASAVLFLILEIPIFGSVYKLDFSAVPVMLVSFAMGPIPGIITLFLKDLIHLIFKGLSTTVGIGNLADFIMGTAFLLPAALIYAKNKSRKNALIGMAVGTVTMALVALLVNGFILFPFYMKAFHMDISQISSMMGLSSDSMIRLLLTATLPFNILKGVIISLITYLIYKPLSPILHVKEK